MTTEQSTPEQSQQRRSASYLAEASGDLVAMSFPGARRIAGWLFWVVFPALCLAALVFAILNIAHHVGSKPDGIRGSFVVNARSCGQGICSFGGSFSSDDGRIKNLPLLGDPRWHSTEVHRVVFDPKSVEVTALPGHWDPTGSVIAGVGAATYLGVVGYFVRGSRRAGRSPSS